MKSATKSEFYNVTVIGLILELTCSLHILQKRVHYLLITVPIEKQDYLYAYFSDRQSV